MKLFSKVCSAVIATSLLATITVPTALAAEANQTTPNRTATGKITFTPEEETTKPVTPPGTEEPEIDNPTPNPDKSPMKIVSVTDLDFKTHEISSSENVSRIYSAGLFETTKAGTEEKISMPHFVRFQDKRSDGEENHYEIDAKITKQFTNGTIPLAGATITYSDMQLMSATNQSTMPSTNTLQGAGTVMIDAGNSTPILVNKEAGKGYGVFDLVFGSDAGENPTAAEAVKLTVPGSTVLKTGDYQGEVTWFISETL